MDPSLLEVLEVPTPTGKVFDLEAWQAAEAKLRTPLPDDIKQFNQTYGMGMIGGEILVRVPVRVGGFAFTADGSAPDTLDMLNEAGEIDPQVAIYPDESGLLAWASSQNGDLWFWVTEGEPNDWTVAVVPRTALRQVIYFYDLNATSYLARFAAEQLDDDFSREWPFSRSTYVTRP